MKQVDRFGREVHDWLAEGPEQAADAVLQATFAVTTRTAQRPVILAILGGTPTMSDIARAGGLSRRTIAVAAAVAFALTALLGVIVGSLLSQRDNPLVIAPTTPPVTSSVSPSFDASPRSSPPVGSVVRLIPETTAIFAATLPAEWRAVPGSEAAPDGYRIVTRTKVSPSLDVVPAAWITISATGLALEDAVAEMRTGGWTAVPEVISAGALDGVIMSSGINGGLDPTALVTAEGLTFRVAAHDDEAPGAGRWMLDAFLPQFVPLGSAGEEDVYRDDTWRFAFVYPASWGRLRPGIQVGEGTTRFTDGSCAFTGAEACNAFVDVVRLANRAPLQLTLPDGRAVEVRMDPTSQEYALLAADWERVVGTSRGSMTIFWQGAWIYDVDNVVLGARFIHRDNQWLAVLSSEYNSGTAGSRLDSFLDGLSLLP